MLFLLASFGCVDNSGPVRKYTCPDSVSEIATDDASRTGFTAEDAWSFLESTPRTLDLSLREWELTGTGGHHPGALSLTRLDAPVYYVEEWGGQNEPCEAPPMLRIPMELTFEADDGSYKAEGPVSFDMQGLTLADSWFIMGRSEPVALFPSDEIQAMVHAVEGYAGVDRYTMTLWSHLDAGEAELIGTPPDDPSTHHDIILSMGDWTVGS
jgi:hypothetical protein